MKKNLFNIDINNSSNANGLQSLEVCEPCASECKKINRRINDRKLSNLKDEEIAHILYPFRI